MTVSIGIRKKHLTLLESNRDGIAQSPVPDQSESTASSKWFVNAPCDYMLVCGGIAWLLFGIHFFILGGTGSGTMAGTLITASALGSLFLSEGHTAATLVRTYSKPELQKQFPLQTKWLPLSLIVMAAIGAAIPTFAHVLVKLYLLTVAHHVMAQAYGIARLYCIRHDYQLDKFQLLTLRMVIHGTVAFATLRQLTYKDWSGTTILGLEIPFWGPLPEPCFQFSQGYLLLSVLLFVGSIMKEAYVSGRTFPLPALITVGTGIAAFTMGQSATGIYWLYVSAFFHATQYLMVVIYSHWNENGLKNEALSKKLATLTSNSSTSRMLGTVLLVSVFMYIGIPRILQHFGCDFTVTAASIFACINLHHVVMDRVLWRLRRKDVQESVN